MAQVGKGGLPPQEAGKAGVSTPMQLGLDSVYQKKLLLQPKPPCPDRAAAISMLPPLMDRLSCDSCDKDIKNVSVCVCACRGGSVVGGGSWACGCWRRERTNRDAAVFVFCFVFLFFVYSPLCSTLYTTAGIDPLTLCPVGLDNGRAAVACVCFANSLALAVIVV